MAVYELTLPLDDATVEKLQVGDIIYLNGQVCTARDIDGSHSYGEDSQRQQCGVSPHWRRHSPVF